MRKLRLCYILPNFSTNKFNNVVQQIIVDIIRLIQLTSLINLPDGIFIETFLEKPLQWNYDKSYDEETARVRGEIRGKEVVVVKNPGQ